MILQAGNRKTFPPVRVNVIILFQKTFLQNEIVHVVVVDSDGTLQRWTHPAMYNAVSVGLFLNERETRIEPHFQSNLQFELVERPFDHQLP